MFVEIQTRVPATRAGAKEAAKIAEELPADLVKEVCGQCPLMPSKPGNEPAHMAFVLNEIARLENRKSIGVPLTNLSPFQEAILIGAAQGRNRSDANRNKKKSDDSTGTPPKLEAGRLD